MANCTQCGATLPDGSHFCTECGATISAAKSANYAPPPSVQPQPVYTQTATQAPPQQTATPYYPDAGAPAPGSKYELISTKGLIGIMLLMAIPVIGQILMIVWALGGCRKLQKRNLARAGLIMMVVAFVLSLILGFAAKKGVETAMERAGITQSEESGGLLSGLLGGKSEEPKESGADGLLGLIGALSGGNSSTGNEDLDELKDLLNDLEAITGEDTGMDDLIDEVGKVNEEAAKNSDGWPSDLPDFPSGTMSSTASYRTEFTGTTQEDTVAYIETLKNKGYEYQDFYNFGMSEAEMMEYGGWWGYNGKWYISISYYDGVATIDHVTELPDLSSILG